MFVTFAYIFPALGSGGGNGPCRGQSSGGGTRCLIARVTGSDAEELPRVWAVGSRGRVAASSQAVLIPLQRGSVLLGCEARLPSQWVPLISSIKVLSNQCLAFHRDRKYWLWTAGFGFFSFLYDLESAPSGQQEPVQGEAPTRSQGSDWSGGCPAAPSLLQY